MTPQENEVALATFAEVRETQAQIQDKDVYELLAWHRVALDKHLKWLDALTTSIESLKQEIQELRGKNG